MDGGSQISVISTNCANRCGLDLGNPEQILLSTFGRKVSRKQLDTTTVEFYKNTENFSGKISVNAFIMDQLVYPIKSYPLSLRQNNFLRDHNIGLADQEAGKEGTLNVDMLIGQDCINQFSCGQSIFLPGGSVLKPTWGNKYILAGPLDEEQSVGEDSIFNSPRFIKINYASTSVDSFKKMGFSTKMSSLVKNVYSSISSEEELDIIETFRNFELLGISPLDYKISPILENFNETTVFSGGRYWVRLPFKDPQKRQLSNNFFQAFSRLLSGHKRRQKTKYFEEAEKYEKSFKDELDLGILEKVETLGTIQEICDKLAKNPQFLNQIKLPDGRLMLFATSSGI